MKTPVAGQSASASATVKELPPAPVAGISIERLEEQAEDAEGGSADGDNLKDESAAAADTKDDKAVAHTGKGEETADAAEAATDEAAAVEKSAEPSQDASSAESATPETEIKGEQAAQDGKGEQTIEGKEEAGEAKPASTIIAPLKPPALPARRAASSRAVPRPPIPARAQPTPPVPVIARSIIPAAGGDDLNWAEKLWQEVVKHKDDMYRARTAVLQQTQ